MASLQNSVPVQATAPRQRRSLHTQANLLQFAGQRRGLPLGISMKSRFCAMVVRSRRRQSARPSSAAASSCSPLSRPRSTEAPTELKPGLMLRMHAGVVAQNVVGNLSGAPGRS